MVIDDNPNCSYDENESQISLSSELIERIMHDRLKLVLGTKFFSQTGF